MSVSVRMPQLGESVTEGTVTRWLKKQGDLVKADEPLLEVSTDKVDTEIPSPASGVLREIAVAEEETVEVGAELAVIDEADAAPAPAALAQQPAVPPQTPPQAWQQAASDAPGPPAGAEWPAPATPAMPAPAGPAFEAPQWPAAEAVPAVAGPSAADLAGEPLAAEPLRAEPLPAEPLPGEPLPAWPPAAAGPAAAERREPAAAETPVMSAPAGAEAEPEPEPPLLGSGTEGPYITPLVRKLASEHGVDLAELEGTGVGGRIRKQDVIEAARALRAAPAPEPAPTAEPAQAVPAPAPAGTAAAAAPPPAARPPVAASPLRGTTERMSRLRQLISQRMVDSLQTSAQLTTMVEVDVTKIARLRERAKADFERREGVKLSFLPFFALATLEALKIHPKLNAVIDAEKSEVTYHDAEHLGIAVDTERGLLVPVIRNAGDLNIGGLARKIADLASRTRSGQVSPDELSGGTFTLTNTGSMGAVFDTPIINQPQVAILGTGLVVKRPVVLDDPGLGEVIAVRSMVYLALTYDHRLVDGADAARFLTTVRHRLEEGTFEAEVGL
jgi:pyruvate dehydrogenase E2 component (dihydrolipoyllysine-residue acetyltransferase)